MTAVIFTICAQNYIGLANVLRRSVVEHSRGVDFRVYVVDEAPGDLVRDTSILSARQVLSGLIPPHEYDNMAFMYDVTEFCTSIKAACFQHAFGDGYESCIYMDPDIFLVADVEHILTALDGRDILITPHLCVASAQQGPRRDAGILATGVYNLGFIALAAGEVARSFLRWWHERLRSQAFNDHYSALYTDQRWIDFVPSLFPEKSVQVWRHLGCNVAPWNYHERRVTQRGEGFEIVPRSTSATLVDAAVPLIFLHFSGFDFRRILDGTFDQLNLADATVFPDVTPIYNRYGAAIRANAGEMVHYLALPYGYATFADGTAVLPSHRRLFRVWRERHGDAVDPFGVGPDSLYHALKTRKLLGQRDGQALAADKATARTLPNADGLLRHAQRLFNLLYRLLGRSRFILLIRSLNRLSRIEQHYDTFGMDDAAITPVMQEPAR
ncbi:hypothetical protein KZ813_07855 [Sphingomonas sp. RHCKR7]|uniref:hypothetical protein n=1 Tax=Sphingomonas folli TaxID=2862497 RepID=UPI001CA5DDC6|nr:hypothetical protein [Sphingomonas folli]MBW6526748.1 hypothetical protein [Sphingomonas folli]